MIQETLLIATLFMIALLLITSRFTGTQLNVQHLSKWIKSILSIAVLLSIANVVTVINAPALNIDVYTYEEVGISFRLDRLSAIMFFMVTLIGLVVIRFSSIYLQGEQHHATFMRRMIATIASVQVLVLSGNLFILASAWIGTSVGLHYLLIFYQERKAARRAAKKKFYISRLGDASLIISFVLIYLELGTANLEQIFHLVQSIPEGNTPLQLEFAGFFLINAAALKSVQLPFHGWLLDVMETPTPVSGLLHAGLLNAGPFLIIRFAHVMDVLTIAPLILMILGAVTAIYGSLVFTSQPAVKTALAYSSIGHMGFSLMVCGMGLYAASLLHFTAHSFYKAHAFLTSGSTVDKYRNKLMAPAYAAQVSWWKFLAGLLLVAGIFWGIAELAGGLFNMPFQLMTLAIIILIGSASFLIRTLFFNTYMPFFFKSVGTALLIISSFFFFEHVMSAFLGNQIPDLSAVSQLTFILSIVLMVIFGATVFNALLTPFFSESERRYKWQVYRRNGFYLHQFFDRFLKRLYIK